MGNNKKILTILGSALIIAGVVSFFVSSHSVVDAKVERAIENNAMPDVETVPASITAIKQSDLGEGFNIGNALDVCDWTYFGSSYNTGFQAAIVYNSQPWSAWDASDYPYFDDKGKNKIVWNINKLNSKANAHAGSLGIQLVNHDKAYNDTSVTCEVTEAKIECADGRSVDLLKNGKKSFDLKVKNDVTGYISLDLTQTGLKTSDLNGSKITVSLSISNYYRDISSKISSLEKYWGNPFTNEDMVKTIKQSGFKTVRVPVTYFNHISSDGTIDKEFLDRVEQVVDWVLENDMYCIIDVHNDTGNDGWIKASADNYAKNSKMVGYIFSQIADRFKDKDGHLILEGLNEAVNDQTQWNDIPSEDMAVMNKWNQLFVDSVRATGGSNADRYLLVNTYAALSSEECMKAFELPKDNVEDRIFVGIHCYYDKDTMASGFERIKKYMDKYDLVIGEWAFNAKVSDRNTLIKSFMGYARQVGIPTILWDNGDLNVMGILNRETLEWAYPDILNEIIESDN